MLQLNKTIGNVLKSLRIKKGLSLNQLAYAYDISKGTLSNIEKGKGYCKFATVWKIVNHLM